MKKHFDIYKKYSPPLFIYNSNGSIRFLFQNVIFFQDPRIINLKSNH